MSGVKSAVSELALLTLILVIVTWVAAPSTPRFGEMLSIRGLAATNVSPEAVTEEDSQKQPSERPPTNSSPHCSDDWLACQTPTTFALPPPTSATVFPATCKTEGSVL